MKGHFFHRTNLIAILDNVLNKTLGEVDIKNVFNRTITKPKITGIAGDVVEQSILGLPGDNKQRPDLDVDGVDVELKTTGIRLSKKNSRIFEAKEPMSITAVSPKKIVNEVFYESNFWHKLDHLLLIYYHYDSSKTVLASEYAKFYIKGYEFHKFSKEDEARLKADWEIVRDFLVQLQKEYSQPEKEYPRLSSELRSKLMYIDTAPKWPNPPRFRLKRLVVTNIVQNHFGESLEQLPGRYYSYKDIDNKCTELTKQYTNKTVLELTDELNITKEKIAKSISEQIVVRMFGGQSKKISNIELFKKSGLIVKTITLTAKGGRTEDMKLFPIDFEEFTNPDVAFEDSLAYDYFVNHQLLCIVFEENSLSSPLAENRFIGFKRFIFSDTFIQKDVKNVWEEIRYLVNEKKLIESPERNKKAELVYNKTGTVKTSINFPKSKNSKIFVRGTGSDSTKKPLELNGIKMYRQDIWIKGSYIAEELKEISFL